MKKLLIALAFTLPGIASAAEAPMWVRDARISPDGSKVAFSYKGDIFTVPYQGGEAVRLTSGPSYESSPVWSPDGSRIAFASDRNGGRDVYVMSADGGVPVRLTFDSTSEIPEAFSADGKDVIFSAVIQDPASSAHAPMRYQGELYRRRRPGHAGAGRSCGESLRASRWLIPVRRCERSRRQMAQTPYIFCDA